jgi:hypothetical protein
MKRIGKEGSIGTVGIFVVASVYREKKRPVICSWRSVITEFLVWFQM